ncbi:MAG TPA: hypothetical protein VK465_01420 [Fibrobacteria bacterium]|nr:hypothetical protein [Fibrobacteria bacterium]
MIQRNLILGTLMAGCLSLGAAFGDNLPGPTDEQKAKFEELKAKMEEQRVAAEARHDSLRAAHTEAIRARIDAHAKAVEVVSEERKALHAEVSVLVEDYKSSIATASDADKAALKNELKEKIQALHEAFRAEHKATLDSLKATREAALAAHKAEWEKRIAEGNARFEEMRKQIEAKREEFFKNVGTDLPGLTAEQKEELRKRFEECIKENKDDAGTTS